MHVKKGSEFGQENFSLLMIGEKEIIKKEGPFGPFSRPPFRSQSADFRFPPNFSFVALRKNLGRYPSGKSGSLKNSPRFWAASGS